MKTGGNNDIQLEQIAARIADDAPVDWSAYDDAAADLSLEGLREIQHLVRGYRHLQSAPDHDAAHPSRFRFGALSVIEPLGSGSQGEVWRAYDPMLDLHVALKLRKIDSTALSHQFLDEAKCLARVRQANIVSIYGAAVHDGQAGLWTELIRGTSLAQLLSEHGAFPADEVRGIGLDLCHALAAVHRHGLLHGDIKAENVMREVSGRIVLMDFGAASEFGKDSSGVVTGSLNYLAPEVLRGAAASPQSDIYALGVLLFHLLGNAYPYAAHDSASLLQAQDRRERVPLLTLRPDLPPSLLAVIERALQIDPNLRPASALAFATSLAPAPTREFSRPYRFGLLAALAALIVIGVIFSSTYWRGGAVPAWHAELTFQRIDAHDAITLNDGASIALGDRLALQFRSSVPAYVYIFDDDGSAAASVLFPIDGIEPHNPLAADTAFRLPGKTGTTALTWQVGRSAERDTFVVVAADTPQVELERAIAAWQHASVDPASVSRGAANLVPAPLESSIENASLRAVLDDLDHSRGDGHVRTWRFVFPHTKR